MYLSLLIPQKTECRDGRDDGRLADVAMGHKLWPEIPDAAVATLDALSKWKLERPKQEG